jgi:uncharacterized coiled-coil protein SlyX
MDKSLDLPQSKPFILDPSVVPTIRRTPADPVEAYFQLSKQINHMDQLSQKAESLLHPETIQLVDQMKQTGVVKTSQLNYLRDSLMSLETERKRLQAQVRILEQQHRNRPSTSGSSLIEKMQSRVNTVEDRLASKERQTQELEQIIQQQKDYISKFQSDLAHLMSLSSTGESAELVEKIRLAKLQLHAMIFPYTKVPVFGVPALVGGPILEAAIVDGVGFNNWFR